VGGRALAWLGENLRKASDYMHLRGSVRVGIVDDEMMARLHERHLGEAGPTDVLTFDLMKRPDNSLMEPPEIARREDFERIMSGIDTDIYVCVDEAGRQIAGRGYAVERELLLYAVHGVLHCLGWDDAEAGGAARMHRVEDHVLEAIGVGRVYARAEGDAGGGDR
jgi:probable rRNA maturation factor